MSVFFGHLGQGFYQCVIPNNLVSFNMINYSFCRFCAEPLSHVVCDLGMSPLSNSHVRFENEAMMEKFYPLKVRVCDQCKLVQLDKFESPDAIFRDYLYFSSYSKSWVKRSEAYCDMMVKRFGFDQKSLVTEVASNDGYLLQFFQGKGIPVLGIEPAANVAEVAQAEKGIRTEVEFLGKNTGTLLANKYGKSDLVIANNVLAHVPDINDFVDGLAALLNEDGGVMTLEFPHLMELIERREFDTIYHEHFSYISLLTLDKILESHGLKTFDVEQLTSHGGSLRVFVCYKQTPMEVSDRVIALRQLEEEHGLNKLETYSKFGLDVVKTKLNLLKLLVDLRLNGKTVVGYGAAAKGTTLLNYCGIKSGMIDYVVDNNPRKQNRFIPGVRIPIFDPKKIKETKPDYLIILPWNIADEIMEEASYIREWGGQFIIPTVDVQVL